MTKDRKHRNQGKDPACCYRDWNEERERFRSFSFEEEQQELQKSLSKDWCDKMDNEEAEEKKLHR